jgi:hypothetical protein
VLEAYNKSQRHGHSHKMSLQELMDYGSEMMEKYPAKKDLIFIGVDDCLMENEDGDERLEKMCDWFKKICNDES